MGEYFILVLLLGTNILQYVNKDFDMFIKRYQTETLDTILCENCWYKNEKGEFSPAEKCLQVSEYFLLSPKGSSKICYVDYSSVNVKLEHTENGLWGFCSKEKKNPSSSISWSFKNELSSFPLKGSCHNNILAKEVDYYLALIKLVGLHINYHKIIKDKKLVGFLKEHLIRRDCSKRFLYYDEKSKKEKIWDIERGTTIEIKDEFEKCE